MGGWCDVQGGGFPRCFYLYLWREGSLSQQARLSPAVGTETVFCRPGGLCYRLWALVRFARD